MTADPTNPQQSRRPTTNPGDEMLTLQEACLFLRLPEGTLRYWRHLGTGPRSFKIGRHVRYWRTDLVLWLTEQSTVDRERSLERATHSQPSRRGGGNGRQPEGR